MWRTQRGVRVLKAAEWELFREGIDLLWDSIEQSFDFSDDFETSVDVFDRLQPSQQLAMLLSVGKALRNKNVPAPDLTAMSEGTVAAVFAQLRVEVAMEIDMEEDGDQDDLTTLLRRRIVAACREWQDYRGHDFPAETSKDVETWESLVEDLANRVLWDDGDYEMEAEFMDDDPEERQAKMAMMGIDPEYFVDIAPDPTDEELETIREALRELTGRSNVE